MNPRLIAYVAFIAAIFLVGPQVSFAAERWRVKETAPGAKVAPTFIVSGSEPFAWPLDYASAWAKVGAPCDCSNSFPLPGMPEQAGTYCLVRQMRAALCEVKK
jgi:hypothetical protein